ncbi:Crp/Fnr family transcriptional regulator [Flammeovirga yaeyamensis]|uniref:Crp/Fnr family transcriptional regulator n=1 Tax=Flammeovirga yaeyamensis TaxID=367791 RepID=A0AAX1N3C3_9BACT|nr:MULTISPECIES: Crp/Fnr family transcriptional regulator [Flammeovirga]ANQ48022.2 Crp/Fnr family transcriptional regulator [Flammeovirga sp. MY04]MBB3695904.1 CRP-like cAMP-binding protein [Flammeovirga yaeyamensis]NMF34593.1 Crp/Fnr family transcriptional regulator [Flammeovirga yaeyamensis]QWG00577.1 Crp/Fnr family transcriptional regulator [Flammeovirga yaeyamensis]
MKNDFRTLLHQYFSLGENQKVYQRGSFILKSGEMASKIYLIHSGAVRVTLGDEHVITIRLGYKGSIIASVPSFFNNQPSLYDIEVIRKCSFSILEKREFEQLIQNNMEMKDLYITVLEDLIRQQSEREIDLLISTPQERYQRVFERSPQLFQEVPHKYIAQYLRMSPETLSRIMKS